MTSPGGGLGSAFVRIRADISQFSRQARRGINNTLADIEDYLTRGRFPLAVRSAGAQAGRDFARMFNLFASRLDIDTKKLKKFGSLILSMGKYVGLAGAAFSATTQLLPVLAAIGTVAGASAAALPALAASFLIVSNTVKFAVAGVGDAINALSKGDMAALDEAMKKLTPSARAFVMEFKGFVPVLKDLQQTIQESFFKPLKGGLLDLLNSGIFDTIKKQMAGIAADAGAAVRGMITSVVEAQKSGQIEAIFAGTRSSFKELSTALPGLVKAFITLAAAAQPFVGILTSYLTTALRKFVDLVEEANANGKLAFLFESAFEIMHTLGNTLLDIGAIFAQVFKALFTGADNTGGVLGTLLHTLREFLESAEGTEALTNLGKALGGIGKLIADILPPVLAVVGKFIAVLAGPFEKIITSLSRPITRLVEDLGGLIGVLLDAGGPLIAKIVDVLTDFAVKALGFLAAHIEELTPILDELLKQLGPQLIPLVEALGEALLAILPVLPELTKAFVEILLAVVKLIPIFVFMIKVSTLLWQAVAVLIGFLATLIGWIVRYVSFDLEGRLEAIALWASKLPSVLGPVKDFFVGWFRFFVDSWSTFLSTARDALGWFVTEMGNLPYQVGGLLASLGSAIAQPFIDGWAAVQHTISSGIQWLMDAIGSIPGRIGGFFYSIYNAAKDLGRAIGEGIANIPGAALNIAQRIVDKIKGSLNSVLYSINNGIYRIASFLHVGLPYLPYLAKGAIVDSPTVAVIGEQSREVVIPLNNRRRALELAQDSGLLDLIGAGQGAGAPPVVYVYIGDEQINARIDVRVQRQVQGAARELALGRRGA